MTAKLSKAQCYYLNISMLIMVKGVNQLINVYSFFQKNLKGCQRSWPKPDRKQKQQHTNNQTNKKTTRNKSKPHKKTQKHTQKKVRILQP